jgi:hypothetical protein
VAGVSWLVLNDEDAPPLPALMLVITCHSQCCRRLVNLFIRRNSVSPLASVLAQNVQGGVQILGAFVTETGGLRYHLQRQVAPWLHGNAQWALRYRNNLCGAYSYDGMTLLELQTIYAGMEDILRADSATADAQLFEGRLDAVHKLLSSTETYTFKPKFQVNPEATLIA